MLFRSSLTALAASLVITGAAAADDFKTTCNLMTPVGEVRLDCLKTRGAGVLWTLRPAPYQEFFQLSSLGNFNFYEKSRGMTAPVHMHMTFPRKAEAGFRVQGSELHLRLTSGHIVRLSSKTGALIGIDGAQYEKSAKSFSLTRLEGGLVLSCGRGARELPYYKNARQPCQFRDTAGKTCAITAGEVFSYKNPEEPEFKFDTDAKLETFLAGHKQCASLDRSPLRPVPEKAWMPPKKKAEENNCVNCIPAQPKVGPGGVPAPLSDILNRVRKEMDEGKR